MSKTEINNIRRLARLYGIQTSYYDVKGQRQEAKVEALSGVLKALGAPLESFNDLTAAIRERRLAEWQQVAEPVTVAWNGGPGEVELRLPADLDGSIACHIELDTGEVRNFNYRLSD